MNNKPTLLTKALHEAFCTDIVEPGLTITCACGTEHTAKDVPLKVGEFSGAAVVENCHCVAAGHFANVLWADRHRLARFLRILSDEMTKDHFRLVGELPAGLGEEESRG